MSVSAAKPWATPGGMNTPRWSSPSRARRGRARAWRRRSGEPSRRSCSTTRAVPNGHVPVVGLVQVVVQPDERARPGGRPVALDHLAAAAGTTRAGRSRRRRRARRRGSSGSTTYTPAIVVGLGDCRPWRSVYSTSIWQWSPTIRRSRPGPALRARRPSTSRPISSPRGGGCRRCGCAPARPSARSRSRRSRSRRRST